MTPRDTGTEPGIAELIKKVDDGFARVDSDIRELRRDTKAGFDKVDKRFEQLDEKYDRKFDRLTLHLVTGGIAVIVALIGLIGAVIAS